MVFTIGRDIGWGGRIGRIVAGLLGVAWVTWHIPVWPEQDWGAAGVVGLYFLAALAVYFLLYLLMGKWSFGQQPWIGSLLLLGPFYTLLIFHIGPTEMLAALGLYVSISFIVNGIIAYGGCEVIAVPTLIVGKRHTAYCPWNAVDAVERAGTDPDHTGQAWTRLHLLVAALVIGYFVVWDLGGLALIVGVDFLLSDSLGWLLLWPATYFAGRSWWLWRQGDANGQTAWIFAVASFALAAMAPALAFGSMEIIWVAIMVLGALFTIITSRKPHTNTRESIA